MDERRDHGNDVMLKFVFLLRVPFSKNGHKKTVSVIATLGPFYT